jgi:AcrR family transcriptional regulator
MTEDLLWSLADQPVRGPRPVLSLAAIARSAIEIADSDGIDAVSMQRVAAALGVTKMALYRYVKSKAELVAVMIETAVGDPPDLAPGPDGWRAKLEDWAGRLRANWQRHPWLPGATVGNRFMGPREIGWTESALRPLAGTGLTGAERMDAVFLLSGHVRNVQASSGTQPWTRERRLSESVTGMLRQHPDRFAELIAATDAAGTDAHDNGWEFGLTRILDGIEQLIAARHPAG